jgi:hypothetical protein
MRTAFPLSLADWPFGQTKIVAGVDKSIVKAIEKGLVSFLGIVLLNLFSVASSTAQAPKKIVFVGAVGGSPPPATSSPNFLVPTGVAIAGSSMAGSPITVFVADPFNNQVVGFPPDGSVLRLHSLSCPAAVSGCFGIGSWTLNSPTAVAAASNGNIWISDTGNDVVLQSTPTGTVAQFAGRGPSGVVMGCFLGIGCSANPNAGVGTGQFFGPGALAVDGSDNLYVADAAGDLSLGRDGPGVDNVRIEKFDKTGSFLTSWGSFCALDPTGAQVAGTQGICNTAASGASAIGDGQFGAVAGIAVDGEGGVYLTDNFNNRVQKFTPGGRFLLKWGGLPGGTANGQFAGPGGVAVDVDQTVYVTDMRNNRIEEFTKDGVFIASAGSMGNAEGQFTSPGGIASVPPYIALQCLLRLAPSDCEHGMAVSELGPGNTRVQLLAGRVDTDADGITDEVDVSPSVRSVAASNSTLGFDSIGTVTTGGDQTFAIYNTLSPTAMNEIRVRTETTGGSFPLIVAECGMGSAMLGTAAGGAGFSFHCSTPTMTAEKGPVVFRVSGSDGAVATGTLQTGDSVSWDATNSTIQDKAGNFGVTVGGKTISLTPGQTAFADATPPTSTATQSASPGRFHWLSGPVAVKLTATDNQGGSGVKSITYSLSGAQPGAGTIPGDSATVKILAEGVSTLSYFATDNAGNEESPNELTVRVDKTPPRLLCTATPPFLKPSEGMAPVTLSVALDDWLSGPAGFVLTSVKGNSEIDSDKDIEGFKLGSASVSGFLRAAKGRVYTFQYTGIDQAGNTDMCTVQVSVAWRGEQKE